MSATLVCAVLSLAAALARAHAFNAEGGARRPSLLQVQEGSAGGASTGGRSTPVTRVVNLLKEMQTTLEKEMDEDEALFDKLACWCNNNEYAKDGSISGSEAKISELEASIEEFTAKTKGLKTSIAEVEAETASDKAALAEATALRKKQQEEFHGAELDSTQAIENLKAALTVLAKHHDEAPASSVAGGAIFKTESDSWQSLLAVRSTKAREEPWTDEHEKSHLERPLAEFLRRSGFDGADLASGRLLRRQDGREAAGLAAHRSGWSREDVAAVKRAYLSASALLQSKHGQGYFPAYQSQSGEIVGVLSMLKEEMEKDLSEDQKREQTRAAAFEELRAAKTSEIENGERMGEQKEDQLATSLNKLAEAKEDLGQEKAALDEARTFLKNLKTTCAEADKNFAARKNARLQEMKAVEDTITILQQDEARDAMAGTFSFMQRSSQAQQRQQRQQAARALRRAARRTHSAGLSVLATSVELDAFTEVKKAIDKMLGDLKTQQADEVKKTDYCKKEIHANEMDTAKTSDAKADLEAKQSQLESDIKTLEDGISEAEAQIAQLQLELQRAGEDRKAENLEFQKTIADQRITIKVLKKALDRLATYYDEETLLQTGAKAGAAGRSGQTPPVPQMKYEPNKGAGGVMQMIEKLIGDSKELQASSRKSESEAQVAYEELIADTNASVETLQEEVAAKSKAKAKASKEKLETESDIEDHEKELEGLAKYNAKIHGECDYFLKNFMARQKARQQEIAALQQAKQILSGASLS